ncbi:DUF4232 domain-containing protein [Kitasatospora azatica]|uniref:DUF4232 domain-containing protein n=1 Tax=Kitasatospora azatica TaxID=58347 RepID=UPI0012FC74A4|nr:DUF4232 domain-containing protein [Kitasatospora azatica]
MRVSKGAAVAATTLVLALGAVACNDETPAGSAAGSAAGAGPTGAARPTSATTAGGGSQPTATATSSVSGASASAVSARCHTNELRADIQLQPDHPGSAMVLLTNKGSRTCTVHGYLGYGGLLADNSPVVVATNRVAHPGAPVEVSLKPGTTAFSGLKWASCDKADPKCQVLAGVSVTPPDETTQLTATVLGIDGKPLQQPLPVSPAGFTVGSLQPSNQGVVFA